MAIVSRSTAGDESRRQWAKRFAARYPNPIQRASVYEVLAAPIDTRTPVERRIDREIEDGLRRMRYARAHGEQPEARPQNTVASCPFCERVPCEDGVHALWRVSKSGQDV